MIDETLYVASRDAAARIARLSPRQVDYWTSTGLVEPLVDRRLTPHRPIRLFGFVELMSLMVASELRSRGVSLQHIRAVVGYLRRQGYELPLTQLTFATEGSKVFFQHPDGSWESGLLSGQSVISQAISLEPLRRRIQDAGKRKRGSIGHIERRRGTLGSKEVVAGTRVPVETVRRYLASGHTVDEVLRSFPVLRPADVKAVRASASA